MSYFLAIPVPTNNTSYTYLWGKVYDYNNNEYSLKNIINVGIRHDDDNFTWYDGTTNQAYDIISSMNTTIELEYNHVFEVKFQIREDYQNIFKFNVEQNIKMYLTIESFSTALTEHVPISNYGLYDGNYPYDEGYNYILGYFEDEFNLSFKIGCNVRTNSDYRLIPTYAEVNEGWHRAYSLSSANSGYQLRMLVASVGDYTIDYNGIWYDEGFSFGEQAILPIEGVEPEPEPEPEPEKEYLNIITNLTNCDIKFLVNGSEIKQGEIEKGVNLYIEITPNNGYYFEDIPYLFYTNINESYIKDEFYLENDVYRYIVDTSNISDSLTIVAEAVEKEPEPEEPTYISIELDVSQSTVSAFSSSGLELNIEKIEYGETVTFIATANNNYYFATTPTIVYFNQGLSQVIDNFIIADNNPDNNYPTIYTYTLNTNITYVTRNVTIHSNATIKQSVNPDIGFSGNYGIATFYNPTIENLRTIASMRQMIRESNYYVILVDRADYIAELRQVFMYAEVAENENCIIGGYDMGFSCPVLSDLIQNIEIGTISLPEYFKNAYDYINTSIRIYLPFYGFYDLDVYKVINQTIHIYYRVYVPTGDSVIIIEAYDNNTANYDIIESLECNVSFKVPYLVQGQAYDTSNLFTNHKLLYGFQSFVEISRNKKQNSLEAKSYNNEFTQLKNLSGFCKCENVFNNISATNQEKNLIDDILLNGFII